jgi:RNA polymerase sigma-70 factor (ECF subfamily)
MMEGNSRSTDPSPPVGEVFARLFAENQRRIFAFILTLLPNREDAEDVFQDVSVVLWKKSAQFEVGTNFSRWAMQIAYFEVVNHRRKKARSKVLFQDDLLQTLADEAAEPDPMLQRRRLALPGCLGRLLPGDRELLMLRYQEGVAVPMLADQCGKSVRALYRTLEKIRGELLDCIDRKVLELGET